MNFLIFAVFKILLNISFPCKIFEMQITADISKIWKTVQHGLIFIFDKLLGSAIGFVLFLIP